MKKSILIIMLFTVLLITGCEKKKNDIKIISGGEEVDTKEMIHEHCTRDASAGKDTEVTLTYDIYYTDDTMNILKSEDKVISADQDVLTSYEEAYKKIKQNYVGIDYYDAEIVRGDTTVTNTVTINYDKIDLNKLMEIEGGEMDINGEKFDIYKNGYLSASEWKRLSKKLGTTCKKDSEA